MMVIKFGGSVITNKRKKDVFNRKITLRLVNEIKRAGEKVVIVHGAGSFGHPYAQEFMLHKGFIDEKQIYGIALTHLAVRRLNVKVLRAFVDMGMPAVSISPFPYIDEKFISKIEDCLNNGLLPVTFGDVVIKELGICSGDLLMEKICMELNPEKAIFVADVDGIYRKYGKRDYIKRCTPSELNEIVIEKSRVADVTGSMKGKLRHIKKIAERGIEVNIVNGRRVDKLFNAIKGNVIGTCLLYTSSGKQ